MMAAVSLLATTAYAQGAPPVSTAMSVINKLRGGAAGWIIAVVVIVALILLVLLVLSGNKRAGGLGGVGGDNPVQSMYAEAEGVESSRFEQLKAEIQGLSLRVQGGENKGYYRKIEQLTRIYVERLGYPGSRQMSIEEMHGLLTSSAFPQKQAAALASIFERSRQGAEHESEKLEFTAAELLKDLRSLVKQTEEESQSLA
jgi:hypothetical protein